MRTHLLVTTILFLLLFTIAGNAQVKIGNNPTTIGTSSVLEIESTNKGVVFPRMTGAQMNAIASPVSGMYVYNTDSLCICQYNGTAWRSMCGGNVGSVYNDWHITGNAATVDGTNFLGTTDNIPFNIRVNNQKSGRIDHLLFNSFYGYQAGNANSTGTGNSFLGYQAGNANTTGSNGVSLGYQAGLNNTAGNNQFVGYQAGYSNTTGTINHFDGYQAGYSNTTGVNNLALGYQSLYTNTTGGFNTAMGYQTLYLNTTGGSNVAFGWSALNKNTTGTSNVAIGGNALNANTTGNNNTAVGANALVANTTGVNNTAMGVVSLQFNTTGGWNTAIGGSTLNKNTTGNSNTALGESTLPNNTTGSYNSGIGSQTLNSNTIGSNNTATGFQAMYSNTSGSHNLADGYQALRSNTSGSYNTATGELAMYADTSGNNNTALGWASLYSNTNGSSNTAIGYGALYPNVIGINKTAVGYQAGFNDSLGNNNTWMGYQADQGVARTTALTNASAIGYQAKANISNSLILGGTGANAVSVGIGTASPNTSSVLDITSTTKGVLAPRMTTAQMNAISVSAATNGLFVYNTDSSCVCVYNGTAWRSMCGSNIGSPDADWHITGNTGTTASTAAIGATVNNNFIGTTDTKDFVLATNNLERMRIASGGNVGLGIKIPATNLNVHGATAAAPNTSGTTSNAILRLDAQNNALDMGAYSAAPYGNWLQATTVANLATNQPLALNPNGGYIGIGTAAPTNHLEIVNDAGVSGADDDLGIKSYGSTLNPQLFFQTAAGTKAAPTNLSNNTDLGSIGWWGQISGSGSLLSKIQSKLTGSGTNGKSDLKFSTSGVEHTIVDSIGRMMITINSPASSTWSPKTSLHMYGNGTSGYNLGGTTLFPNPSEGPEIGFGRGGFNDTLGAAIQFIDYDSYSGGLAFLVHRGTQNNAGGAFANNWPTEVLQAMTIVNNGQIGIGTSDPKAKLHIMAGAAAIESAPLKFTTGVAAQTILEAGAVNYDGSNLTLSDVTYAYTITKSLNGSASLNFPSTVATAVANLTITVTGAALGDPVVLGVPNASVTATATFSAFVSAANTVTVRFSPKATEDPAAGTFTVRVVK